MDIPEILPSVYCHGDLLVLFFFSQVLLPAEGQGWMLDADPVSSSLAELFYSLQCIACWCPCMSVPKKWNFLFPLQTSHMSFFTPPQWAHWYFLQMVAVWSDQLPSTLIPVPNGNTLEGNDKIALGFREKLLRKFPSISSFLRVFF